MITYVDFFLCNGIAAVNYAPLNIGGSGNFIVQASCFDEHSTMKLKVALNSGRVVKASIKADLQKYRYLINNK